MHKGLKIFLGILGGLAAAVLLTWLIAPGLPVRIFTNKMFIYQNTVLGD